MAGWEVAIGVKESRHGSHIAPGETVAKRESFAEVVPVDGLREAIRRLG